MRNYALTILLFALPMFLLAQSSATQVIRGQVTDKDTGQPLIGATISIADSDPLIGTVTDVDGNFRLAEVPVGRVRVLCSYVGYESFASDNIIVNSAKEVVIDMGLVAAGITTEEVVVTAFQFANEPLNAASLVSTRSFSVDETQRYAASANDPGRMAQGFPGVQPTRDSRSDIIIRGNSGIGMLWRLEGIDIVNPHHFARRGSSGGGITVFSVSMLGNSDFSTGAFPAEYGNAFSGVFDVHLRRGNREQREYSFRAGILGLDLSTEGPIKKGGASYLVNYRYSTLGLLNQMGIYLVNPRTDNIFQDLSFKLHFPSKNNKSSLSIWGIGGLSSEYEREADDLSAESTFGEKFTRDFDTDMGAVGATYNYLLDEKSYLRISAAAMGQRVTFSNDTVSLEGVHTTLNDEAFDDIRYVFTSFYNRKLNDRVTMKLGAFWNNLNYDLFHEDLITPTESIRWLEENGSTNLIQPYLQFRLRPAPRWTINAGLHAMFLTLNNTSSIEPRLGMQYQLSTRSNFSLAYGLHSRMVPIGTYFTVVNGLQPNLDLELIKSHHFVAAFDQMIGQGARLKFEAYYQRLFDVPVGAEAGSPYSILNEVDGYATQALVSEGEGRNVGLDLTFEKAFQDQTFFLLAGSVFNSTYSNVDGTFYDTRYNSNYTLTFLGGKEFTQKNNATLQTSIKLLFNGGGRITPLLAGVTADGQTPPYDWSRPYAERISPYFRPDIRVAYRKDNPNSAWTLSLDIQNAIGRRNEDNIERVFDPDTGVWTDRIQSGLTPILSFQVDW